MNDRRLAILLLAMGIGAAACSSSPATGAPDQTGIPVASPMPPAMSLFDTGVRPFEVVDFDAVHQPLPRGSSTATIRATCWISASPGSRTTTWAC